ncbi:MAG: TetR family transcriptional regulator [Marmoricola sp.]|nr:TetR family transcriptional regulator [Marmoricola sp.]
MASEARAKRRAESARRILEAARAEFAEHGFDGATIRAIAARAGVDPSLVMQHHGSKAALFRSAVKLDSTDSSEVQTHLQDVIDHRLAGLPPELYALVRSMLTVPEATAQMRDYLDERATSLAQALQGDDAEVRATLIVCEILGLTLGRHFLHLRGFESVSEIELARVARNRISDRP